MHKSDHVIRSPHAACCSVCGSASRATHNFFNSWQRRKCSASTLYLFPSRFRAMLYGHHKIEASHWLRGTPLTLYNLVSVSWLAHDLYSRDVGFGGGNLKKWLKLMFKLNKLNGSDVQVAKGFRVILASNVQPTCLWHLKSASDARDNNSVKALAA